MARAAGALGRDSLGAGRTDWRGGGFGGGRGLPGDTRAGSKAAMAAVAKACRKVTLSTTTASSAAASGASGSSAAAGGAGSASAGSSTLYDCQGRADALARVGG